MSANSSTCYTAATMNDAAAAADTIHSDVVSDERQLALGIGNSSRSSTAAAAAAAAKLKLFPHILHDLLEEAHAQNQTHIVSWVAQGTAFKVHDKDAFVKEIMPKYFRSSTYKSFQRSLNIWGFGSVNHVFRTGIAKGSVYHEHFLRGMVHLCRLMKREKVKGEAARLKRPPAPSRRPSFVPLNHDGIKCPSSFSPPSNTTRRSPVFLSNHHHHENQKLKRELLKALLIEKGSTIDQNADALAAALRLRSGTDGYGGGFCSQEPPPPPLSIDIATLALALLLSSSNVLHVPENDHS